MRANINLHLGDGLEAIKQYPDNYWQLAILDPPYGIGEDGSKNHSRCKLAVSKDYKAYLGNDLEPPSAEFFKELIRVSKNQIIWGANHFISRIPYDSSCWIVWDKDNGATDFADCELAWTSFPTAVRKIKWKWQGMLQENMKNKQQRIHPNEKPIKLYEWLLQNYAKEGDKILDTFGGSMSIAIAAWDMKFDLDLWEIDPDYYKAGKERFEIHRRQTQLF